MMTTDAYGKWRVVGRGMWHYYMCMLLCGTLYELYPFLKDFHVALLPLQDGIALDITRSGLKEAKSKWYQTFAL